MKLGHIISHPSLGKKVYLSQLLEDGSVVMVDLQIVDVSGYGDEGHYVYKHNLESGIVENFGWSKGRNGREKDLANDLKQAKPLTTLVIARLLDESVDSKQLFQALKSEGCNLEGYSLFKNYLGKWRIRCDASGEEYSIISLINTLEND